MVKRVMHLNRWLAPFIVAILLLGGTAPTALAQPAGAPQAANICMQERGRPQDKPPPPGQLVRRGLVGSVTGVTGDGHILVEIAFGTVEVIPPSGFDLGGVAEGVRIAALLDKDGGQAGATQIIRVAQALRITIVPSQSTRVHQTGVVLTQGEGLIEVVNEEGEVEEMELSEAEEGGVQVLSTGEGERVESTAEPIVEQEIVEEGGEAVLLVQCEGPEGTPTVRSLQRVDRIAERMAALQARAEAREAHRNEKLDELQQRWDERHQDRLDNTLNNAPPGAKEKVKAARDRVTGTCVPVEGQDCPREGQGQQRGQGAAGNGQGDDTSR